MAASCQFWLELTLFTICFKIIIILSICFSHTQTLSTLPQSHAMPSDTNRGRAKEHQFATHFYFTFSMCCAPSSSSLNQLKSDFHFNIRRLRYFFPCRYTHPLTYVRSTFIERFSFSSFICSIKTFRDDDDDDDNEHNSHRLASTWDLYAEQSPKRKYCECGIRMRRTASFRSVITT